MLPRPLRTRAARARAVLRRLRRHLVEAFPTAPYLVADPSLAERIDTTLEDHHTADALVALDALINALDNLHHRRS